MFLNKKLSVILCIMAFMVTIISGEEKEQMKAKLKVTKNNNEDKETEESKQQRAQEAFDSIEKKRLCYIEEKLKTLETIDVYVERKVHVQEYNIKMGTYPNKGPRLAGGFNKFSANKFKLITIEKLKKEVVANNAIIVDLNGHETFTNGHIPHAINGFANYFESNLPKDKKILIAVYFPLGDFDAWNKVADIYHLGHTNISYLNNGLYSWLNDGGTIETSPKEKFSEADSGFIKYKNKIKDKEIAVSIINKLIVKSNCEKLIDNLYDLLPGPQQVISIEELKKAIAEKTVTLIDLSGYENYLKGHLPLSLNGYENNIISKLPTTKNNLIVFYFPPGEIYGWSKFQELTFMCSSNKRFKLLDRCMVFTGGIPEWLECGGKLEK